MSPPSSRPSSGGPLMVGRVVDPLASDEGGDEILPPLPGDNGDLAEIAKKVRRPQPLSATPPPAEVQPLEAPSPAPLAYEAPTPSPISVDDEEPDGLTESLTDPPVVEPLESSSPQESAARESSEGNAEPKRPLARGAAMRERLLSRAAEIDPERAALLSDDDGGLDAIGRDSPVASTRLDRELDSVGTPSHRPPAAPVVRRPAKAVSPTLVAVFGTILGLATVATLVAVLMHVAPQQTPGEISKSSTKETAKPSETGPSEPRTVQKPKRKKVKGPWRLKDDKGKGGLRFVKGKIGREPFLKVVQDKGLEKGQAYRLLKAFEGVRDFNNCKSSDQFQALIERKSKKVKAFEYIVSAEEVYQAREADDGLLKAKKLDLKVERGQARGVVVFQKGSFSENAKRAGFDPGLASVVRSAIRGHMGLSEMSKGDVLRLVLQEVTVLGEFARYAGVEALEYLPKGDKSKALRLYYFRGSKTKGYFDGKGRSPYEGGWRKPIPDAPITSRYNPKRMHPVLKRVMPHNGTDFGAPAGTPIGASSFGTVSFIGYAGASGNLVKVEHSGGIETGYAHLSKFAEGLKVGDKVKRMQVVGYCGSTGRSTGPHLHFSAKKNGRFVDPESLNLDALTVLPRSERAAFKQVKSKYDALLEAIQIPAAPEPEEPDDEPEPTKVAQNDSDEDSDEDPAGGAAEPSADEDEGEGESEGEGGSYDSVFMTDEDLLKAQSRSDDGEVNE